MNKSELIAKLLHNENSAFTDTDENKLAALSDDMLKRLYLSATTQPANSGTPVTVPVTNTASAQVNARINELKQSLLTVQSNLRAEINKEKKVLMELEAEGIKAKPIMNEAIANTDIEQFVQNSQSPVASVLREALEERNKNRQALIEVIVTNSDGLYANEELVCKTTDELQKLAALSSKQTGQPVATNVSNESVLNWQGAGIGNLSIVNDDFAPLNTMSTWD
jgi:hypothetical protein